MRSRDRKKLLSAWLPTIRLILEKVLNGIIFYIVWIACILFAAVNEEKWALLLSLGLLTLHFFMTQVGRRDAILMASLIAIGFTVDTSFVQMGMIRYSSPNPLSAAVAPLWILTIWAVFGVTLNHSMWWLKGRYFLAAVLGAWGGTASYVGGERLGAATFLWPYGTVVIVLAVLWFFLMPAILWWSTWVDRHVKQ